MPKTRKVTKRKPRKKAKRKVRFYLGWDGSYVLSKFPLTVHVDKSADNTKYLSTGEMFSIDDIGPDSLVFRDLKLKKFEVIRVELVEL